MMHLILARPCSCSDCQHARQQIQQRTALSLSWAQAHSACSTTSMPSLTWASMRMFAGWLQAACALPGSRTTWFEPVSAAKAVRGVSILRHLDFISPNLDELVAMASQLCPDRLHALVASSSSAGGSAMPEDERSGSDGLRPASLARAALDGVRWAIQALLQVQHLVHQCHHAAAA